MESNTPQTFIVEASLNVKILVSLHVNVTFKVTQFHWCMCIVKRVTQKGFTLTVIPSLY